MLVAALVTGAGFATRLRPAFVGGALLAAVVWLTVAFTPLCAWAADGLVRRDVVKDADGVMVLGSRLQTDGEPTEDAMSRLLHGLRLVADGRAPRLLLSELPPPSRSYADLARAWMRSFHLEATVVVLGPVRNTHDEAVAAGEYCRRQGLRSLIVVTSPTHSRRAAAAVEHEGIEVTSSPSIETDYDLETLDWPSERLQAFGSVLHERAGFWVYARRGWVAPGPKPAPAATLR